MKKKIVSMLLSLCLFVGSLSLSASAVSIDAMWDVSTSAWYYSAAKYCVDGGYMNGTGESTFSPNGVVTRAQVVQILYNMAGKPKAEGYSNPFYDVGGNAWYTNAIKWAKGNGIANGASATTFAPNKAVTREQVAVMFKNYKVYTSGSTPTVYSVYLEKYSDKYSVSSWAQSSVNWAVQYGLMSGTSASNLTPQGTCTRAQLAQFIKNYFEPLSVTKPSPISLTDIKAWARQNVYLETNTFSSRQTDNYENRYSDVMYSLSTYYKDNYMEYYLNNEYATFTTTAFITKEAVSENYKDFSASKIKIYGDDQLIYTFKGGTSNKQKPKTVTLDVSDITFLKVVFENCDRLNKWGDTICKFVLGNSTLGW